jgi:hypothetical protein
LYTLELSWHVALSLPALPLSSMSIRPPSWSIPTPDLAYSLLAIQAATPIPSSPTTRLLP